MVSSTDTSGFAPVCLVYTFQIIGELRDKVDTDTREAPEGNRRSYPSEVQLDSTDFGESA